MERLNFQVKWIYQETFIWKELSILNILPLFFEVDEFCQRFEPIWNKYLLAQNCKKRNRRRSLALSEVMTILILFHQSGYRNLKQFYAAFRETLRRSRLFIGAVKNRPAPTETGIDYESEKEYEK